jgi:hypothetical protein
VIDRGSREYNKTASLMTVPVRLFSSARMVKEVPYRNRTPLVNTVRKEKFATTYAKLLFDAGENYYQFLWPLRVCHAVGIRGARTTHAVSHR